ncbi:MAG: hypothetical protein ABI120_26130 [Gemmatimonadaceae bacterium]
MLRPLALMHEHVAVGTLRYIMQSASPGIILLLHIASPTLTVLAGRIPFRTCDRFSADDLHPTGGPHEMMTERDATHSVREGQQPALLLRTRNWRRRRVGALVVLALSVSAAACSGVLPSPSREAAQGQIMMDLTDALNQIRDQSAGLQDQVDSLREVVYHQDTIIRQLAQNAGITVPPPK